MNPKPHIHLRYDHTSKKFTLCYNVELGPDYYVFDRIEPVYSGIDEIVLQYKRRQGSEPDNYRRIDCIEIVGVPKPDADDDNYCESKVTFRVVGVGVGGNGSSTANYGDGDA